MDPSRCTCNSDFANAAIRDESAIVTLKFYQSLRLASD
jgi:hypothetical protein